MINKLRFYNVSLLLSTINELVDRVNSTGTNNTSFETITWASSINLNFATSTNSTVNLGGNTTFTGSSYTQNTKKTVRIVGDGSIRNLVFPGNWKFVGDVAPVTLAAGKVAILELFSWGSTDSDVTVIYSVQP
jgi:hypothetical protein